MVTAQILARVSGAAQQLHAAYEQLSRAVVEAQAINHRETPHLGGPVFAPAVVEALEAEFAALGRHHEILETLVVLLARTAAEPMPAHPALAACLAALPAGTPTYDPEA